MGDITRDKTLVRPISARHCIYSDCHEAGDTIEAGEVVRLNGTSGWVPADASDAAGLAGELGIVVSPQDAIDGDMDLSVVLIGLVTGFTGMTPGALHFVSDNDGEIGTTAGSKTKNVGYADSATVLYFNPNAPANPS